MFNNLAQQSGSTSRFKKLVQQTGTREIAWFDTLMSDKVDTESFKQFERLRELRVDHRDLDYLIDSLSHDPLVDQLRIRRLKKRRLILKDMISQLESELIPDMDA